MEDSEKPIDSVSLEEAMADSEKPTQEGDVAEEDQEDMVDDGIGMADDGTLEGVLENEDVEMPDGVAEDSENNNLAPEDSMDGPGAILESEDGSEEVSQGTISNSEAFLGDQFISQTDSMIVQSEPPQQLMEEAEGDGETGDGMIASDIIGEGSIDEGTIGEGLIGDGDNGDESSVVAETDSTKEPSDILATDQTGEELTGGDEEAEAELLHQEDEGDDLEPQDESGTEGLDALQAGITLQMEEDAESGAAELQGEDSQGEAEGEGEDEAEDPADNSEEGIVLHLEEDDGEDGTEDGAESMALLAQAEAGPLGKIAVSTDGSVQDTLQGIQLMEGDDKPEEAEASPHAGATPLELQAELNAVLLKQEEMKEEEEDQPESESDAQPSAESDALATLASAALDHQAPTNGVKTEHDETQIKTEDGAQEPQWMDVGICKGTHCQVRSYFIPRTGQNWDQNWEGITTSTLPDHRSLAKLELESGKAYKFRVAAINSCGRGPWSEVAAFKTSLPGFPGAPSAIKIAKTTDGAHLSWEPPPIASGVIEDYHVYLAVRTATTDSSRVVSSGANQLAFVRIYQGAANQCTVGNDTLSKAHIDMTTKPAILFRISARNEKGIGPATQVRWLQEVGAPTNNATRPTYAPRRPAAETKPHGNYKRKKSE